MRFFQAIRFVENMLYPVRWARSWLGRLFKFGGKGFSLTLAGKVATTVFFMFFFLWLYFLWANWSDELRGSPTQWLGWKEPWFLLDQIIFFLLVVTLSICVYWGVRLAILEKVSLYPEIDRCWDAVSKWKNDRNFEWNEFNRYYVLGTNYNTANNMHADESDDEKNDGLFPVGTEEWIHAFGAKREMYVHLNKVCNLSCYLDNVKPTGNPTGNDQTYHGTLVADEPYGESLDIKNDSSPPEGYGATEVADGPAAFKTIDPDDSSGWNPDQADESSAPVPTNHGSESEKYYDDDDTPDDRLQYFCEYVRSNSDSELPFNGVLVSIPFDAFGEDNYREVTNQIRKDLIALRKNAGVNFPVTFLFTSMENDSGFPKLQHLLGLERAKGRFGAGCKVQNTPSLSPENFDLQVARSCTTFEKWVFDRWSRNSQLSNARQNKSLYKMLIRVRQGFKHRLEHLLNHSLLWKDSELPEGETNEIVLAGCYFASTGNNPGSRAFLPGLYAKCNEFAQLCGWGNASLYRDRVFSVLASTLFTVWLGLIAVVIFFAFFN